MGQSPGDEKNEPSLELPSLSLRGLRRSKRTKRVTPENDEQAVSPSAASPDDEPTTVVESQRETPVEEPADIPATEPRTSAPAEPEPLPEPELDRQPLPEREPEPTPVLTATHDDAGEPAGATETRRPGVSLPTLPGRVAAAVTGLAIGGAGAVATYAAMAGCEAVRGVRTCGGGPGFFILVAILVVMVLLGMLVLKALQVGDPGSTSFLAVGIVTVVVMLMLLDVVFSPWMFLVIPLLGAAAFTLAHWVTTQFGEETGRPDWS